MSKLKTKIFQQIQKLSSVFFLFLLVITGIIVSQNVDADWIPPNPGPPPSPGYFFDTPTSPHEVMTYELGYVNNDFTTSPMFVEIRLAKVDGLIEDTTVNANDYIEVVEIIETWEVDDNKLPLPGANVRSIDPAAASFAGGPNENQVKLILTPRHDETNMSGGCVPDPNGGCKWDLAGVNTTWDPKLTSCNGTELPYNVQMSDHTICEADPNDPNFTQLPNDGVKGKYEIKIAIKPDAPAGTISFTTRRASLNSPRANDVFGNPWYINIDYDPSAHDEVLDPNGIYSGEIMGASGTGEPTQANPYTVVVNDIKAVSGNNLEAPSGTCSTVVGGTTYTSTTGITNGTCVIDIPVIPGVNDGDIIPGGTIDINDGGVPHSITKDGVVYNAKEFMTGADLADITNVDCGTPVAGATATCTFDLPVDKLLPNNFEIGVGTATPAGTCTTVAPGQVECTNVPVGPDTGLQDVIGKIDVTTADIGDATVSPAVMVSSDIIDISNVDCGVPIVNSTATCTFDLPLNKSLPVDFNLGIGDAIPAGTCTTVAPGQVECVNVPTGSTVGLQDVYGQIGVDPKETTGEQVDVQPGPLTDADFPGVNVYCEPTEELTTTCSFVLPGGVSLPSGTTMGTGDAIPGGTCTENVTTSVVTCTNVPVGSEPGLQDIFVDVSGDGSPVDTGEDVYIIPNNLSANDVSFGYFEYSPNKGGSAPYFNDPDDAIVTFKDFKTGFDPTPEDGNYSCLIETRKFTGRSSVEIWEPLNPPSGDDADYNRADGCSTVLPKTKRGMDLNWSVRVTLTDKSDPTRTFEHHDAYIFKIAGTGTIF